MVKKALVLNTAACSYMILGEYDSTAFYLEHCLDYAHIAQSSEAQRKALNNFAVLYQLKGDFGKALEYLGRVKTCNENQSFLNHLNLATTYEVAHLIDSAKYYYKTIEQSIGSPYVETDAKCTAYKSLSVFAERNGDIDAALGFRKKYDEIIINILDTNSQKSMYRIQQKYDYEALQSAMSQRIAARQRIIIILCALLAILAVILTLSQHKLVVKTQQEAEAKKSALHYIQKYYEAVTKRGETMQKVAIVMNNRDDLALMNNLSKTVFGTKEPWVAIAEVFDTLHPGERKKWEDLYPGLNDLEQKHLLLSYFGVSRQDEALLLKISIHSVDKLRQKVKEKTTLDAE